jgi:hypothetical protein
MKLLSPARQARTSLLKPVNRSLRLSTWKAIAEISPSVGTQSQRGFPRSNEGRCPRLPLI